MVSLGKRAPAEAGLPDRIDILGRIDNLSLSCLYCRMTVDSPALPETETRQEALLEAAVGVFARYGFRKTSMDEVARAAGVSRQGLYLQFADKEALFRQAVTYKLSRQLRAAIAELSKEQSTFEARLIAACDEWAGRFVGFTG